MRIFTLILLLAAASCTEQQKSDKSAPANRVTEKFKFFSNKETNKLYLETRKVLNKSLAGKRRTKELLQQFCDQGNFAACRDYISKISRPSPGETSKQQNQREQSAFDNRWRLCKAGHYELCRGAGQSLLQNAGQMQESHSLYYNFIKEKCDAGFWQGCELLFFYAANIIRDEKIIEQAARDGCNHGKISMCTKLANRVANSNEKEFAELTDKICKTDVEQCSALISFKSDYKFPQSIIEKLTDECSKNIRICESLVRYAIRNGKNELSHKVLKVRCSKQVSRCIELGIFEAQNGIENHKVPLNKVCQEILKPKRRKFEHRFEKFAEHFCKNGSITGSKQKWITYNPHAK